MKPPSNRQKLSWTSCSSTDLQSDAVRRSGSEAGCVCEVAGEDRGHRSAKVTIPLREGSATSWQMYKAEALGPWRYTHTHSFPSEPEHCVPATAAEQLGSTDSKKLADRARHLLPPSIPFPTRLINGENYETKHVNDFNVFRSIIYYLN